MKPREELLEYWRQPGKKNNAIQYLRSEQKALSSKFLVSLVKGLGDIGPILEPGCNAGRNLWHLWNAGYKDLTGIDINEKALILMGKQFPEMEVKTHSGDMSLVLPTLPRYDLIFTMAVLTHIHPDAADGIFEDIAVRVKKYLITLEAETADNERHTPRNYGDVFNGLGLRQVEVIPNIPGMSAPYVGRVFER